MAYEITNLFKELEIPTSVTGKDEVIAAIDKQIKIWQARVNNPRYKLEATSHTSALKKLRAEVISNPSIISQHAAAYSEIEKRERIRKEKDRLSSPFQEKSMLCTVCLTTEQSPSAIQIA